MGNLTSKLATEVSDKQTFRTPSVYTDGSRFKIEECLLINLEDDGKTIKVSKDDPNSEDKAFPVFKTSLGGNNQFLFVSTLFKARPGLDKDGKLVSFLPSGKFTDEVKATIVGLGYNPTLSRVKDALNGTFKGKEILCKWQELTAISRDGRQYADHVYVLDYATPTA
jgi:hypothetical protein